jgi:hypothetical protein
MEAASSTETSVNIYQAIRCHVPGDSKRQEKIVLFDLTFSGTMWTITQEKNVTLE